jgi:hypothetical protein
MNAVRKLDHKLQCWIDDESCNNPSLLRYVSSDPGFENDSGR